MTPIERYVNTVNMSDVRDRLVQCARDLFLETGYNGFSMRKVAACAGVSATAIYRHFSDREDLLVEVVMRGYRVFTAQLKNASRGQSPLEHLEQLALSYVEFALSERSYYEFMFMTTGELTGLRHIPEDGRRETQQALKIVEDALASCIREHSVRATDATSAALELWAFCHGLISLYFTCKIDATESQFRKTYAAMLHDYVSRI